MPIIAFKAKRQRVMNADGTDGYTFVQIPKITRAHCDMAAFRAHPKFGGYANSDLFPSIIKRALHRHGIGQVIRSDRPLPDGVTVDDSGFLTVVRIQVDDWR